EVPVPSVRPSLRRRPEPEDDAAKAAAVAGSDPEFEIEMYSEYSGFESDNDSGCDCASADFDSDSISISNDDTFGTMGGKNGPVVAPRPASDSARRHGLHDGVFYFEPPSCPEPDASNLHPAEQLALRMLAEGAASYQALDQLLTLLPHDAKKRRASVDGRWGAGSKIFSTGAYYWCGASSVRRNLNLFPHASRLLAGIVGVIDPDHKFSTLSMIRNVLLPIHRDDGNLAGSHNLVIRCSVWDHGEIWIEQTGGSQMRRVRGNDVPGELHELTRPVRFNPHLLHGTHEWEGTRTIITAFHVRGTDSLACTDRMKLSDLQFRIQ
ncbi:unnamed protein product, partial [Symbiodinium necroappetens]